MKTRKTPVFQAGIRSLQSGIDQKNSIFTRLYMDGS